MSYSTIPSHSEPLPLDLTIRAGLKLVYYTTQTTPITLLLKPRLDVWQYISKEQFILDPRVHSTEYEDHHGNIVLRMNLPPGQTTVIHDTLVSVPSAPENFGAVDEPLSPEKLPASLLRYTLPSRYCESDNI
jgi:transglutaminase-like putative cysteine protease